LMLMTTLGASVNKTAHVLGGVAERIAMPHPYRRRRTPLATEPRPRAWDFLRELMHLDS
jgi:hypothetical protein